MGVGTYYNSEVLDKGRYSGILLIQSSRAYLIDRNRSSKM